MTPEELEIVLNKVFNSQNGDVTSILTVIISALAVLVAYWQLKKINDQIGAARISMKADHDRTRRLSTLDAVRFHNNNAKPEFNKAKTIFESLSVPELEKLYKEGRVTVPNSILELVCAVLEQNCEGVIEKYKDETGAVQLSYQESMLLRFLLIDFLNHIEACLLPWYLGIADEATMEIEFLALVQPHGDDNAKRVRLYDARRVVGVEKFPATEAFVAKVCAEPERPTPRNPIIQ